MSEAVSRILITGSKGFIGSNLAVRLAELPNHVLLQFNRGDDTSSLPALVAQADVIVHLAGENRPKDEGAFIQVNVGLTSAICEAVKMKYAVSGEKTPIILASSSQAGSDTPYGRSKLGGEDAVRALCHEIGNPGVIFRLPGVFGKWCKPNYNSVVATFCHNIAHDLEIRVDDPMSCLRLVYIDDVIDTIISVITSPEPGERYVRVDPEYQITLGDLAAQIKRFENGRGNLWSEHVGSGLTRALYATYLTYLPHVDFAYAVPQHCDDRGVFVEILKTPDCGQVSFLTAMPGVTRGGHYHHTKVEKFLVIKGEALFRFRQILTDKKVEIKTTGDMPMVVETIPGWSHDITNVGSDELLVILWANEVFDHDRPDTISSKV